MVSGPSRQTSTAFSGGRWLQTLPMKPIASCPTSRDGTRSTNSSVPTEPGAATSAMSFTQTIAMGHFLICLAVLGLDFLEDGRAFALADFDHDGRLEIVLKNRNAPQLRLLKNVAENLPPSIAFHLQGTKSNRDAIGAVVTIETSGGKADEVDPGWVWFSFSTHQRGFLRPRGHKGADARIDPLAQRAGARTQRSPHQPPRLDYRGREGFSHGSIHSRANTSVSPASPNEADSLPARAETWLLAPVVAPDFSLPDQTGQARTLSSKRGKSVLLNFWAAKSEGCRAELP